MKPDKFERLRFENTPAALWLPFYFRCANFAVMSRWPWRYGSRPKVVIHDIPWSLSGEYLYQAWKWSLQWKESYRTVRYASRSKFVIHENMTYIGLHSLSAECLYQLWKESLQWRRCYEADMISLSHFFLANSWTDDLEEIGHGQKSFYMTRLLRRRQAIIWTNAGMLLIWPIGTIFSETLSEIYIFSLKRIHLKMPSGHWRPFCLGLNV